MAQAALFDAPGVSSPYNWVGDIGGPVNPNSLNSVQLSSGSYLSGTPLFWFTLNSQQTYDPVQDALTANTFNQMGIMGGPLKHADGTANVGGVVTLTLVQRFVDAGNLMDILIGQAVVNLTSWAPGQFYWSPQLPTPISIWGNANFSEAGTIITRNYIYAVYASCPVPYSVYAARPCTLLNGNTWGSQSAPFYSVPYPNNDHACGGSVDLTLNKYQNLSTASLTPVVAFSGAPQRKGGLRAPLVPQVHLMGQLGRPGVFEGDSIMVGGQFVLNASLSGGPLWKPAKLCTG